MNENLSDDSEIENSEIENSESSDGPLGPNDNSNLTDGDDTSGPAQAQNTESSNKEETKKTPAYVIVVGIVLTLLVIACLQVDDWSRDWTTNYAETDPAAKDINLRPVESDLSVSQLTQLVNEKMSDITRWKLLATKEVHQDLFEIELVHKTFWFGFKDDVKVRIVGVESGSIMSVTSQSRIGKGDLGQNPRNIKELVSIIRAELTLREKQQPKQGTGS